MQPRDKQRIEHILNYCTDIEAATERFGKDMRRLYPIKIITMLSLLESFKSESLPEAFPMSFGV